MLGELALVGYRKVNCSACEVIYQCTNYGSTYLNWELSLNGQFSHISMNILRNPEGSILIDYIGPHPVKYEVISTNTTFIRATLTMDPVELDGAIIKCNIFTLTLSSYISSKLSLYSKQRVRMTLTMKQKYNQELLSLVMCSVSTVMANELVQINYWLLVDRLSYMYLTSDISLEQCDKFF